MPDNQLLAYRLAPTKWHHRPAKIWELVGKSFWESKTKAHFYCPNFDIHTIYFNLFRIVIIFLRFTIYRDIEEEEKFLYKKKRKQKHFKIHLR
jgi:hypothetical protein